jgi:predicted nucleic acid-binding protein
MTSYSLDTDTVTKLLKIAAHAIEYGAAIVTGNVEHFQDIGARVEDWNQ